MKKNKDLKEKVMAWIHKIAQANIDRKNLDNIVAHIGKHVHDWDRMITEHRLDDWLNSMMNIIFIYRESFGKELIDYEGMYSRLVNHSKKSVSCNVQEDGTIEDYKT